MQHNRCMRMRRAAITNMHCSFPDVGPMYSAFCCSRIFRLAMLHMISELVYHVSCYCTSIHPIHPP